MAQLLLALTALISASFITPAPVCAAPKYRLGVSLPLSGDTANWGKACQNGMELALEGLPPELRDGLEVIYEDDQVQPAKTTAALHKLIDMDQADAVVSFGSGCGMVAAPIAEAKKIPHISVASDPRISKDRKYTFNLWVTPETEAVLLISEAKRLGYRRVARLSTQWEGFVATNKAVDEANQGAFDIVMEDEIQSGTKDFRSIITKLKARNDIDALFLELMPGQVGIFIKQMRRLGVKLPLLNIETFEDPNDVKASEGAMIGLWYVQADDATDGFLKKLMARFPGTGTNSAGNCHDIVLMTADSVKKKLPLEVYLENVKDFTGSMGTYSSTGDHRFTLPATIKVVTEKGFEKRK